MSNHLPYTADPRDTIAEQFGESDAWCALRLVRDRCHRVDAPTTGEIQLVTERWLRAMLRFMHRPVTCRSCGRPVEPDRDCYAVPMCHACLPPPAPLPVREVSR